MGWKREVGALEERGNVKELEYGRQLGHPLKDAWVAKMWKGGQLEGQVYNNFYDYELEELEAFFKRLYEQIIRKDMENKLHNTEFFKKDGGKEDVEGLGGEEDLLGFEKDAVGWMIEYLTKAIEMKSHLGFIRISEFATNRKSSVLIIPEGDKGRGWENIKNALSSMLVVPYSNAVEKGRKFRGESCSHNHVGSLHRSYAKAVSGEGPKGCGLVLVGRWAQAVVCESNDDRSLGKKGVVTIVPISGGKGVFFVETTEEAIFLHDRRNLRVEERNIIQLRKWSPKENAEIVGKFKGG
ncbi:hypothetical protein CK203_052990 [Vitis vinifera]|uniref:DUF4283 domain-containing protein n=1 Tax=Vitis vinifera TaxID=29760 RepID=A0A438GMN5_VITVI|nr:hypothetical protein CK203_052990 [Vitis vinifera]